MAYTITTGLTLGQKTAEFFANETRGQLQKMTAASEETLLAVLEMNVVNSGKSSGK